MNASLRTFLSRDAMSRLIFHVLLTSLLLGLGSPSRAALPRWSFLAALPAYGSEPSDPHIISPSAPCTITSGTALTFEAIYAGGKSPRWILNGPGASNLTFATGAGPVSYTFSNPGTFTVMFIVGPDLNYTGGSTSMTVQVNGPTPKPSIISFTASPSSIARGGSATLTWSQTGATSVSLVATPGGAIGFTQPSVVVYPVETTNYTLTATNSAGADAKGITITVSPVSISGVTPAAQTVNAGGQVKFSATVTGATNTGVNWSVTGGGVIDGNGLFTATTAGTYTVTAQSAADTRQSSNASVTVKSVVTGVNLSPMSATLNAGGSTTFTAQAAGLGGNDSSVTWAASGGTLAGGTYTAPVAGGSYTVTATSVQDHSKSATATVTVKSAAVSAVTPAGTTVSVGTNVQFSATVSDAADARVLWSANNGGSIDSSGLFLTTTPGSYIITATSALDTSKASQTSLTVTDVPGAASMAVITSPSGGAVATKSTQTFSATSTADPMYFPNYQVTGYAWDFGDGTRGSGASASHAYGSAGTYTATLTVNYQFDMCKLRTPDGDCNAYQTRTGSRTATRTLIVKDPPSIASFTAIPPSVPAGHAVTLGWVTSNASSLVISGVGTVTGLPSCQVYPASQTRYVLTATNEVGQMELAVEVSTYTVGVSVTPGTTTLLLGGKQKFTATVVPANQGVTWTSDLPGAMADGTFTGLKAGTYRVTATSLEDSTQAGWATVTVQAASISALDPGNPTVDAGTVTQFGVTVDGAVSRDVTWSVTPIQAPADGANIDGTGRLTATKAGTYQVTAASVLDSSVKSSTTVTVRGVVTISPSSAKLAAGDTVGFTAQVLGVGGSSPGVLWTCTDGTITAGGVYTAPATSGTYKVRATSDQDSRWYQEATVNVASMAPEGIQPKDWKAKVGEKVQFTASITGAGDNGVNWSIIAPQDQLQNATIDPTGVFIGKAPGTFKVEARSIAFPEIADSTNVIVEVKTFEPKWKRDIVYLGGMEVAEIDANGAVHTTLTDHLGTPRLVVGMNGVVESVQKYLPFGQLMEMQGAVTTSKGFTNHEQTDPSGLIYMQARFYAPMYGRFLSPDPARDQHFEETQSWNIYSYVRNNPTMQVDPTGMLAEDPPQKYQQSFKNSDAAIDVVPGGGKMPQTGGAESTGQFLDRKGTEAALAGNNLAQGGWAALSAAYNTFTPGGDRLSDANAKALNGQQVSGKELAVDGAIAISQVALTAAPQVLGAAKPLQGAVNEAFAAGGTKSQPINILGGKIRLETHMEAVPKSVQKALGVKVSGAIMKPWHLSVMGHDIPLNPFNQLWKLFK